MTDTSEDTLPKVPPAAPGPPGPVESAIVKALVPQVARKIMLGTVDIDWDDLSPGFVPLGVNHDELEGKCYLTQSKIRFYRGGNLIAQIDKGYSFDGASVPHIFWGFRGFSPIGRHLWSAMVHDAICDQKIDLWPIVGDALFVALLRESGVSAWRSAIFYAAVRFNHLFPKTISATSKGAWLALKLGMLALAGVGVWKLIASLTQ